MCVCVVHACACVRAHVCVCCARACVYVCARACVYVTHHLVLCYLASPSGDTLFSKDSSCGPCNYARCTCCCWIYNGSSGFCAASYPMDTTSKLGSLIYIGSVVVSKCCSLSLHLLEVHVTCIGSGEMICVCACAGMHTCVCVGGGVCVCV